MSAKADAAIGAAGPEHPDDAGPADAGMDFEPRLLKGGGDAGGGAMLGEAELGMGMEIASKLDQRRDQIVDFCGGRDHLQFLV